MSKTPKYIMYVGKSNIQFYDMFPGEQTILLVRDLRPSGWDWKRG